MITLSNSICMMFKLSLYYFMILINIKDIIINFYSFSKLGSLTHEWIVNNCSKIGSFKV